MAEYNTRLEKLLAYWEYTRRAGHTSAQLSGVSNPNKSLLVVANLHQAHTMLREAREYGAVVNAAFLTINNIQLVPASMLNERLHTTNKPLTIDHYALHEIAIEHTRKVETYWKDREDNGIPIKVRKV